MKNFLYLVLAFVLLAGIFSMSEKLWTVIKVSGFSATSETSTTKVYYCRKDACDKKITDQLLDAKKYAYFAIYTITRDSIVDALIAAKLRGIEVRGVIDFGQSLIAEEKPKISRLKRYGIEIRSLYKEQGIMHIKMLVTDQVYVSGSFNWTTSANDLNDEVLEVGFTNSIHDQYLKVFSAVWNRYAGISTPPSQ